MALSLITYFCTMVSALAILAVLLSSLISPHHVWQPHPIALTGQAAESQTADALTPKKCSNNQAANV